MIFGHLNNHISFSVDDDLYIPYLLQQEALQQQTDAMAREATDIAADCVPPNVETGKAKSV